MSRDEDGAPRPHRLDRGFGERRRIDVPLVGQPGLDDHARPVPIGHDVRMLLHLLDKTPRFQIRNDLVPRVIAVETAISLRRSVVDHRVLVEDVHQLEIVPSAHFEVVEVVRRRDLDRARALFRSACPSATIRSSRPTKGSTAYLPIRSLYRSSSGCTATAVSPSIVSGRVVATTMARPSFSLDGITYVPEVPLNFPLLDFEVGNRRVQLRVPVDQTLVLID